VLAELIPAAPTDTRISRHTGLKATAANGSTVRQHESDQDFGRGLTRADPLHINFPGPHNPVDL
jgi:hypothetical protein